jgi:hypothetical protein
MALIESDRTPLSHARLTAALIPGEFNRAVLDILAGRTHTEGRALDGFWTRSDRRGAWQLLASHRSSRLSLPIVAGRSSGLVQ